MFSPNYVLPSKGTTTLQGNIHLVNGYKNYMKSKRVNIELSSYEFEALKANSAISDICGQYLKSAKRLGDYVMLDLFTHEANDLIGWVAAEANHAKSARESDLLNSACDAIEANI